MSGEEKTLTVAAIASRLNVADSTVRQWINTGKLRAYELPGSGAQCIYRIEPKDLEWFLKTHTKPVVQAVHTGQHSA